MPRNKSSAAAGVSASATAFGFDETLTNPHCVIGHVAHFPTRPGTNHSSAAV